MGSYIGQDDEGNTAWVAGWEDVERDLTAFSAEDLDKLVFAGCERHPLSWVCVNHTITRSHHLSGGLRVSYGGLRPCKR
jgi:hypothetical protein